MKLHQLTAAGACAECGGTSFELAEGVTYYTPVERTADGQWKAGSRDTTTDTVRLFCWECGAEHAVPEELL
jgi:hypothetical protein